MANIASAAKRARQSARRAQANRAVKSQVKTRRKQVEDAIASGDKAAAQASMNELASAVDKACKTNVIHSMHSEACP